MKTTAKMIAIIFLLGTGLWMMPQNAQAHYGISYQVFYDDLSPYGTWIDSPEYGFVWVPDAGPGFMPYNTSGYWTYSVYGWTWVSNYPWGWAPFHYGRWSYDNWYGWVWIPGHEWGPGWVTWRQCNGYYGWAPMTPGFNIVINVNWNMIPINSWVFVPDMYFGRPEMNRYYVNRAENDRFYKRSTVIAGTGTDRETNVKYYAGPEAREVGKVTGREIRPIEVTRDERPGQTIRDGKMNLYRPEVKQSDTRSNTRPAPEKYNSYQDRSKKAEPMVRNNTPVENTRKQVNSVPVQKQATPPQTRMTPNQERVAPPQARVTPNQERVAPQQERKTQPQNQGKVNADRKPLPPVRQPMTGSGNTKQNVKQSVSQNTNPASRPQSGKSNSGPRN